mgnify:CR=1 FL=1
MAPPTLRFDRFPCRRDCGVDDAGGGTAGSRAAAGVAAEGSGGGVAADGFTCAGAAGASTRWSASLPAAVGVEGRLLERVPARTA